jgi:succinate dehydrogenase / fumarate reductase flavoprotein subunit
VTTELNSTLLDPKIPEGPIQDKWTKRKFDVKLVNPANRRKYDLIVVGTGLAGAGAAAALGELGYNVKAFTYNDSSRRAHSIAAQGGINAAKNYPNDNDSVFRLFYDTVKGGDYRSREANVYRLAEVSNSIIDQTVAQGAPYAREYGGLLDNRSFGGAQVSRTFYARGQTGQQLLLTAYQALARQVGLGNVELFTRTEMLELVTKDGRAVGIVTRDLVTGEIKSHSAHAVVLATGGYSNVYFLSTNAMNCNGTAAWRAYRKGAFFANPSFTQIHPTCIPASDEHQSKLTLMSESLRNDGRIWVPGSPDDSRAPNDIPEEDRDYYLERKNGVYLDFADSISRLGRQTIEDRYGNLFEMYERITDEDPYQVPMRIYPAPHYTMGGLWVDYNLETTIPGLFASGEANFSDHGANRLGASALMQGVADGYFVLPATISGYLANWLNVPPVSTDDEAFVAAEHNVKERLARLLSINGTHSVDYFHRRLGKIMIEECGMSRDREGLEKALQQIPALQAEFWNDLKLLGTEESMNQSLERAGRVADFLELAELMVRDALDREESCGGHFRVEHQTEDGEARRDDDNYSFVSAWQWTGEDSPPKRHAEPLEFEYVALTQRSYK